MRVMQVHHNMPIRPEGSSLPSAGADWQADPAAALRTLDDLVSRVLSGHS
jgi:hypothetical protein